MVPLRLGMRWLSILLLAAACARNVVLPTDAVCVPGPYPTHANRYGCAPCAAANVLCYWGLDTALAVTPDSLQHLLAYAMSTDSTGATDADAVPYGMAIVSGGHSWLIWDYSWRSFAQRELVRQVDAGRPCVVILCGHPQYGNHAVTAYGYGPLSWQTIYAYDGRRGCKPVTIDLRDTPCGVVAWEHR